MKDQAWSVALFNEMATTPATLEASRLSDFYACLPDHTVESRDVEQAYLQARLEGPKTFIQLPKELWTDEMKAMRCPVFELVLDFCFDSNLGRGVAPTNFQMSRACRVLPC